MATLDSARTRNVQRICLRLSREEGTRVQLSSDHWRASSSILLEYSYGAGVPSHRSWSAETHEAFEGYPVPCMNPAFQKWTYVYDAAGEA